MAELVWKNRDLREIILSFAGINPKYCCEICNIPLNYRIFIWKIKKPNISRYYFKYCRKIHLCSEECLIEFQNMTDDSDEDCFCMIIIIICLMVIIFTFFVVFTIMGSYSMLF